MEHRDGLIPPLPRKNIALEQTDKEMRKILPVMTPIIVQRFLPGKNNEVITEFYPGYAMDYNRRQPEEIDFGRVLQELHRPSELYIFATAHLDTTSHVTYQTIYRVGVDGQAYERYFMGGQIQDETPRPDLSLKVINRAIHYPADSRTLADWVDLVVLVVLDAPLTQEEVQQARRTGREIFPSYYLVGAEESLREEAKRRGR